MGNGVEGNWNHFRTNGEHVCVDIGFNEYIETQRIILLYLQGIGMLPDPRGDSRAHLMTSSMGMPLARPFRPIASTSTMPGGGYTTGGAFMFPPGNGGQQTMVFSGGHMQNSGGHVYGTLPVVSTILSSNQADGPMRPAFQPIGHPAVKNAKLMGELLIIRLFSPQ